MFLTSCNFFCDIKNVFLRVMTSFLKSTIEFLISTIRISDIKNLIVDIKNFIVDINNSYPTCALNVKRATKLLQISKMDFLLVKILNTHIRNTILTSKNLYF